MSWYCTVLNFKFVNRTRNIIQTKKDQPDKRHWHWTSTNNHLWSRLCMHSQWLSDTPLHQWVSEDGPVQAAYRDYLAGLGKVCTHVVALFFAVVVSTCVNTWGEDSNSREGLLDAAQSISRNWFMSAKPKPIYTVSVKVQVVSYAIMLMHTKTHHSAQT